MRDVSSLTAEASKLLASHTLSNLLHPEDASEDLVSESMKTGALPCPLCVPAGSGEPQIVASDSLCGDHCSSSRSVSDPILETQQDRQ